MKNSNAATRCGYSASYYSSVYQTLGAIKIRLHRKCMNFPDITKIYTFNEKNAKFSIKGAHVRTNTIFIIFHDNSKMPLIWNNKNNNSLASLHSSLDFIVYCHVYDNTLPTYERNAVYG